MLPQNIITIELPQMLNPGAGARSRVNVIHNQAVKAAGRHALIRHQVETIPLHFQLPARGKYRHHKRSPQVQEYKRRRGQPDLVKRGKTRYRMTKRPPHSLRARGTAAGGMVTFTMVLKFPFPVSRETTDMRTVTVDKMAEEISRILAPEEVLIAKNFRDEYVKQVLERLKPRMLKRLTESGRLGALGIT